MPKVKRITPTEVMNITSTTDAQRGELYTKSGDFDLLVGDGFGYTVQFWHRMIGQDDNFRYFVIKDSDDNTIVRWHTTVDFGKRFITAQHFTASPSANDTVNFPQTPLDSNTNSKNPVVRYHMTGGSPYGDDFGKWNLVTMTWNGKFGDVRSNVCYYVNKIKYGTQVGGNNNIDPDNFPSMTGGRLVLFGEQHAIGNGYEDMSTAGINIYSVACWDRALTHDEVKKIYDRKITPLEMGTKGPKCYWRMRSKYFSKRNYPWSRGNSGLIIHHRLKSLVGPDLINQSNQGSLSALGYDTTHDIVTDDTIPFDYDEDHYSGITSGTPQNVISEIDSLSGQYPTISRTGDSTRKGHYNINFDDTNVINFIEGEAEITYPQLLKPHNKTKHPLLKQDGAISPHNSFGSITTTANINPNLTSNYSLRGDRKLISDRNNQDLIVNGEAVAGSTNVSPFIDSRIDLSTSTFYMTGTATSTQPGFESRLHDKTQIKLTLPNTREEFLTRSPRLRNNILDSGGDFYGEDKTGFVYYNWNLKRWEQIGLVDPATGNSILHDFAVEVDRTTNKFVSGTNNFPMQFYPTPQNDRKQEFKLSTFESWPNAGYPHINSFAPLSTKYYATSSQTLLMSDYINSPFLLEKVVVSFPYTQRRTHTGTSDAHDQAASASIGQALHQADYVFFMYRQDQKGKLDSVTDVSGSDRHLIVSGCMSFYNSKIVDLSTNSIFTDNQPLNSPAFSIDHGITSESSSSLTDFSEVTGVAKLELIPASVTEQVLGGARIPSSSLDDPTADEVNIPQYYWPGGTSYRNFGQTQYTGRSFSEQVGSYGGFFDGTGNNRLFDEYDTTDFRALSSNLNKIKFFDTRINSLGGNIRKLRSSNLALINGDKQTLSPYLLLPEDRLIFGIDNPMALHNNQDMNKSNELTGSFLKLRTDLPVEITLYGSKIRANKEFHDTLNQNLTTLQVHEGVYQEQPLDQFIVATEREYSGSYMDDYTTGSVGSSVRSIIGSGENVLSGSFQRFRAFNNRQQRFYDTIMPNIEAMWKVDGVDLFPENNVLMTLAFGKSLEDFNFVASLENGSIQSHHHQSWRKIFPFESRYNRVGKKISQKTIYIQMPIISEGVIGNKTFMTVLGQPDFPLPFVGDLNAIINSTNMFLFGFGSNAQNTFAIAQASDGFHGTRFERPRGYKYGILNVLPQFTKNIYRGDKFGQRADMLEQAQDSRFLVGSSFTSEGPLRIRFVADDDEDDQYIILDEDEIIENTFESSNVSIYATSSLPFFDEDTPKNRTYNNTFFANRVVDIIGFDS